MLFRSTKTTISLRNCLSRRCRVAIIFTCSFLNLFVATCAYSQMNLQDNAPAVPDEVLLRPATGVSADSVAQTISTDGTIVQVIPQLNMYRIKLSKTVNRDQIIGTWRGFAQFDYVTKNHYITTASQPNDIYWNTPYLTGYPAQYGPKQVKVDLAWDFWTPKSPMIVAVLDSGIDDGHPDLTNKMLRNPINNSVIGQNEVSLSAGTMDDNGHGTHVAGIIAAQSNNSLGIAGMSGWNGQPGFTDTFTKLMPVKVSDNTGTGTEAQLTAGLLFAADSGANVINMSLSGYNSTNTFLQQALDHAWQKGCLLVIAAGNGEDGTGNKFPGFSLDTINIYPATYANALTVAASDHTDTLAGFSNYGSPVAVAAPGSAGATINPGDLIAMDGILSTTPRSLPGGPPNYPPTNYAYYWGTSQATPIVSGEAALLWSQNPFLTNTQIKNLIVANVDPVTPYVSGHTIGSLGTGGRVNALKGILRSTGNVVATGDMNGDGKPDLIWESPDDNLLSCLFLNGTTRTAQSSFFHSAGVVEYGVSNDYKVVGTSDVDGDGKPDLIWQNRATNTVSVWYMNGTTWTGSSAVISSTVPSVWKLFSVVDINNDGIKDFLFYNTMTGDVAYWLMSGTTVTSSG